MITTRFYRYLRLALGTVAIVAAAALGVITLVAGAAGAGASGGVLFSSLWLGVAGYLLLRASWVGWWLLAVWLMVPLRSLLLSSLDAGQLSAPTLVLAALIGAVLFAIRNDLPAPPALRALPSLSVLLLAFPLWLAATEVLQVVRLASIAEGSVYDPYEDKALSNLLAPWSVRCLAANAANREVRRLALGMVTNSAARARIEAAAADTAARDSIIGAFVQSERVRVRSLESPFAGTYRFEIAIEGAQPITVFGRTELHPSKALWNLDEASQPQWPSDTTAAKRSAGYALRVTLARILDSLPSTTTLDPTSGRHGLAELRLGEVPLRTAGDSSVHAARTSVIPGTSFLFPGGEPPFERVSHGMGGDVGFKGVVIRLESGHLRAYSDGRVTIETQVLRGDSVVVSVKGTRISTIVSQPHE